MSKGWAIETTGEEDFIAYQSDITQMAAGGQFGAGGDFALRLSVDLLARPTQIASADEEHALLSFSAHPPSAGTNFVLLELGVTPSGRIYGRGPTTNKIQTSVGLLEFRGSRAELLFTYATSGTMEIRLNDVTYATGVGAGGQPQPESWRLSRWTLFNGPVGGSRVPCRMHSASYEDENAGAQWFLNDGRGLGIVGTRDENDIPADPSLVMSSNTGFRWVPWIEWEPLVRTPTTWVRG